MSSSMSVGALSIKIKSLLETTFMHISVEGEIASVTYHNSGHIYFSIKDQEASIKCVMFRSNVRRLKFRLERGQHLIVHGSISVYAPRGEYQFLTVSVEPFGQGALAMAYEQLKSKLQAQGYFDPLHKKVQPRYIKKLALVTASKGAALQDMLKVIQKRWQLVEVVVIDTLVQGDQAAPQIVKALQYADGLGCDAIVMGRGGGSREDLWAFNEEVVADALFHLQTFVVSAVGHEVDTLISDFVADLRAPTPSAAIEMILPDQNEILYTLSEMQNRYVRTIRQIIANKEHQLMALQREIQHQSVTRKVTMTQKEFTLLKEEYTRVMDYKLLEYQAKIAPLEKALDQNIEYAIRAKREALNSLAEKFKLYNPKVNHKEGWAEVVAKGKRVPLAKIGKGERFFLIDTNTKIEVNCLTKEKL